MFLMVSSAGNEDIPVVNAITQQKQQKSKLMSLFYTFWIQYMLPKFCVTAHSSECRMAVKDVK